MRNNKVIDLKKKEEESKSELERIIVEGVRRILGAALVNEVEEYVKSRGEIRDEDGRRIFVRNGSLPSREILTGLGPVVVEQPRVRDRRGEEKFTSAILPPYLRRVPSLDALIPALYLKGISSGDFGEALSAILGENAAGLSATNIVRLKQIWEEEYAQWKARDLSGREYVYLWADGIYFNVRLEEDRPCILVLMGALEDGTKELVGIWDGYRESKDSWKEMLLDLKKRGLKQAPKLAIGDGALGFWAALREVFSKTREQRCWVHKTANILDKLPKKVQPQAKRKIHAIYMAPNRKLAEEAYGEFMELYSARYPKACECLEKDRDELLAFYDFPAAHWRHIRTTNPIESAFATIRLRTKRTKGCGSRMATLTMVFKLAEQAEKHWRKLNGHNLLSKVVQGVIFIDGDEVSQKAA